MKSHLPLVVLILAAVDLSSLTASATSLNWDGNGTDPVDGGTGTWGTTSLRWTTTAYANSGANYVSSTTAGATADLIFGGGAGTVTLSGAPAFANSQTFSTGTYIIETNSSGLATAGRGLYSTTGFFGVGLPSLIVRPASGADASITLALATGNSGNFSGSLQNNGVKVLSLGIGGGTTGTMGEVILDGANTYSGKTTLNAGQYDGLKLTIDGDSRLGTAPVSAIADSITFNSWATLGTTLRFTESTNLNANRGIEIGRSSSTNAGIGVFEVDSGKTVTYNGAISRRTGNTGFNNISIKKSGLGTLSLGGANTYDGTTTIASGILEYAKVTALYNGTTSSWTAGNICVLNGATLALNIGGVGEFSSSDVTTLLTNLTSSSNASTNGMAAGSLLGFDTTNASNGSFTISNNITNTTGTAGGNRGLVKLGMNTLLLTGSNSYTGQTIVAAGTLAVNGSLGNSPVTIVSGANLKGAGSITGPVTFQGGGSAIAVSAIQTMTGGVNYNGGAKLSWGLNSNSTENRGVNYGGQNITGGLNIASGAILDLSFNASGSSVDFSNVFWQTNRTWLVVDGDITTGSFTLGTISDDTNGRNSSTYGTFSISVFGNDVYLNWAATPVVEPPVLIGAPTFNSTKGVWSYPVTSAYQATPNIIEVLLPGTYTPSKKYQVLYVLPVETGSATVYGDSLQKIKEAGLQDTCDIICVRPTFTAVPWYGDHSTDRAKRQESYMNEVVLPLIESRYSTVNSVEGRLLVGFSKSGWGAFSLLMRNPGIYGYAAAWDSPMLLEYGPYATDTAFADNQNFQQYSPETLIGSPSQSLFTHRRLLLLGECLFGSEPSGQFAATPHTTTYHTLLTDNGIPHYYDDNLPSLHEWNLVWLRPAVEALVSISRAPISDVNTLISETFEGLEDNTATKYNIESGSGVGNWIVTHSGASNIIQDQSGNFHAIKAKSQSKPYKFTANLDSPYRIANGSGIFSFDVAIAAGYGTETSGWGHDRDNYLVGMDALGNELFRLVICAWSSEGRLGYVDAAGVEHWLGDAAHNINLKATYDPSQMRNVRVEMTSSGMSLFLNNVRLAQNVPYNSNQGELVDILITGESAYSSLYYDNISFVRASMPQTPAQYVSGLTPPTIKSSSSLKRLSTFWPYPASVELNSELADRWGYCMHVPIYLTEKAVVTRMNDHTSDMYKIIQKHLTNPSKYPLRIALSKEYLPTGPTRDNSTAEDLLALYPDLVLHDDTGAVIMNGTSGKYLSPEAPDAAYAQMAQARVNGINSLRSYNVQSTSVILNSGEYDPFPTPPEDIAMKDPAVRTARGSQNWRSYIQTRIAQHEKVIYDAVSAAIPHDNYAFYIAGSQRDRGGRFPTDPGTYGLAFPYAWTNKITQLPASEIYYSYGWGFGNYSYGSGASDPSRGNLGISWDMLSTSLNGISQNIAYGAPLSYNWLSAGNAGAQIAPWYSYMGFLKCLYSAGMLGGVEQLYSNYDDFNPQDPNASFDILNPPNWLTRMLAHSHVWGLFTQLDNFLTNGTLLEGNGQNALSYDLPAYEFYTGDANVRVLARKLNSADEWLLTAWLASDVEQPVTGQYVNVTLPIVGLIRPYARTCGTVYHIKYVSGAAVWKILDADPDLPSNIPATPYTEVDRKVVSPMWNGVTPVVSMAMLNNAQLDENTGGNSKNLTLAPSYSGYGAQSTNFYVSLDKPTNIPLTVNYSITYATANASDFVSPIAGSVVVPAGAQKCLVGFTKPNNDTAKEGRERYGIQLLPGLNYALGNTTTVTSRDLYDDDKPTVVVSASPSSVSESSKNVAFFRIILSPLAASSRTIQFAMSGTATLGIDYNLVTATGSNPPQNQVTIPPGEREATVTVVSVRDGVAESNETITLTITPTDPVNYDYQNNQSATVTLTD